MLKKASQIFADLKTNGYRITPIRKEIIEILINNSSPISAIGLIEVFKKLRIKVNKTTIYRELDFLMEEKLVKEVEFGEGRKRYEINTGHHHHLVCLNCKKVEDIDLETDLSAEEKIIEKNTGFRIESHSLEFFGYCKDCESLEDKSF